MKENCYKVVLSFLQLVPCWAFAASGVGGSTLLEPPQLVRTNLGSVSMRLRFKIEPHLALTGQGNCCPEAPLFVEGIVGGQVWSGLLFFQTALGHPISELQKSLYFNNTLGYRVVDKSEGWMASCHAGINYAFSRYGCQWSAGLEGQNEYGVLRGNFYGNFWGGSREFESKGTTTRLAKLFEVFFDGSVPSWPSVSIGFGVTFSLEDSTAWTIAYPGMSQGAVNSYQGQEENRLTSQAAWDGYFGLVFSIVPAVQLGVRYHKEACSISIKPSFSYRFDRSFRQQVLSRASLKRTKTPADLSLTFIERRNTFTLMQRKADERAKPKAFEAGTQGEVEAGTQGEVEAGTQGEVEAGTQGEVEGKKQADRIGRIKGLHQAVKKGLVKDLSIETLYKLDLAQKQLDDLKPKCERQAIYKDLHAAQDALLPGVSDAFERLQEELCQGINTIFPKLLFRNAEGCWEVQQYDPSLSQKELLALSERVEQLNRNSNPTKPSPEELQELSERIKQLPQLLCPTERSQEELRKELSDLLIRLLHKQANRKSQLADGRSREEVSNDSEALLEATSKRIEQLEQGLSRTPLSREELRAISEKITRLRKKGSPLYQPSLEDELRALEENIKRLGSGSCTAELSQTELQDLWRKIGNLLPAEGPASQKKLKDASKELSEWVNALRQRLSPAELSKEELQELSENIEKLQSARRRVRLKLEGDLRIISENTEQAAQLSRLEEQAKRWMLLASSALSKQYSSPKAAAVRTQLQHLTRLFEAALEGEYLFDGNWLWD